MRKQKFLIKQWKVLALCLMFAAPIVAGFVTYFYKDNLNFNINPRGQLISPPLPSETLGLKDETIQGQWQLVFYLPEGCSEQAQEKKQVLNNLIKALGKDQTRVKARTVSSLQDAEQLFEPEEVLIVDPKGWVIMRYRPSKFNAKGMLEDLKRLLRFSHVG